MSLFKAKVRQAYCPCERLGFPTLRFGSCDAATVNARSLVPSASPCGNWGLGNCAKHDTLAAAAAVSNIVLCLWFLGLSASSHETAAG